MTHRYNLLDKALHPLETVVARGLPYAVAALREKGFRFGPGGGAFLELDGGPGPESFRWRLWPDGSATDGRSIHAA